MVEGHDWSKPPFARKTFYWPFWMMFGVLTITFAVVLGAYSFFLRSPAFFSWFLDSILFNGAVIVGASLFTSLIYHRFARVELTPQTITTMNDLCLRQTVPLHEIETVKRPWYGLGILLRVKQKGVACQVWILLHLVGWDDFAQSIVQVAEPGNPLREYIENSRAK